MISKDKLEKIKRERYGNINLNEYELSRFLNFLSCSNQEAQDHVSQLRTKHDRQVTSFESTISSLQTDVERLNVELEKVNSRKRKLEEEIRENDDRKEEVENWEKQISEIIQWFVIIQ